MVVFNHKAPVLLKEGFVLKQGKVLFVIMTLMLAFAGQSAMADQAWVSVGGTSNPASPVVTVLSSDESTTTIEITTDGFWSEDITEGVETFQSLELPGYSSVIDPGKPCVPAVVKLVQIPSLTDVAVTVTAQTLETLTGYHVYPSQTPLLETETSTTFDYDQTFYGTSQTYPVAATEISDPAVWRNIRVIRLTIYPIRHNPATGDLTVATDMTIRLDYSGTNTTNQLLTTDLPVTERYDDMYSNTVINYPGPGMAPVVKGSSSSALLTGYDYLIIADDAFVSSMTPFVNWKNSQGLSTQVVAISTIGANVTNIKNYITQEYNTNGIQYVLLVGNDVAIPGYTGYYFFSDFYYTLIAGGDNFPDIALGRFSVDNTTELNNMITKSITYESNPPAGDWLDKALLVAHKEYAPGKYQGCKEEIRTASYSVQTPVFTTAYGAAAAQGGDDATNADVKAYINSGQRVVNYRGHGDVQEWWNWNTLGQSFYNSDALSLANGQKTPVVFSIACLNADLLIPNDCLGEAFTVQDEGAVAFLGASDPSYTIANHTYDKKLFKAVYDEGINTIGDASNVAAIEIIMYEGGAGLTNARMYLWLGDPSLNVLYEGEPPCTEPIAWESTWGDTLSQMAHSVVQTSDGGYAFCGRVGPYDAAILYSNIQLVKTDSCGEVEWTREYGGDSADWAYSIDATEPDDGFIICGSTTSYGMGGSDIYLIKTDANGNVQWTQTHGTTGLDWGKSVKQTSDGGYIAVGTLPEHDFLILKLDQYGNTVWADTCFDFYGFEWYNPGEVIETNDGKFVVAGSGFDDDYIEYFIILFTWDSSGNQIGWNRYYHDYAHGYGVVQTSDNGFAVCGYDADTSGANEEDFFILKTNSAGGLLWTQSYDINNCDIANSIKQLSDGGYIVVGESGYLYYGADMYVLRTDASGNTIWGKTYGGAYRDDGKSIQICSDGGFVIAGCSYSFGDDENGDFYMVKMGPEPPAPILYSPINGKYWYTTSMVVPLDWHDVDGAILYEVLLDNNSDFSSPIANPNDLTVSTWTTPALGVGTYYWKVRAKNETGWGAWSSVRYFQLRTPTGGGCPILFTFDGNDFRKENPLLTACEKSGFKDVVTDYYHLSKPPACEDGIVTFQLRETVDEVTYLHDLELITVDHSDDVGIACAVDGSIMTYHEILTPLSAVDDQGRDQLASVIEEDGNFFTADEPGHLIVTFPNPGTDLTGFSFYALKKPDIIVDPPPGPKLLPYAEFNPSDLTIEILGNDNLWHEIEAQIPSREYLLQEMVLTDYASGIESDEITIRLSWSDRYATDVLLQYVPADEYPIIENWAIDEFDLRLATTDQESMTIFSKEQPLVLRKGDVFEYTFDVGPTPPEGLGRDYIIRAMGRYEPAGLRAGALPTQFQLYGNYPNPFNPATTIAYDLPTPSEVKLNVYNILGQLVATVYDGPQDAGHHEAIWDGNDSQGRPVASGVYIYHLEAGTFAASKKMVLMK